VVVLFASGVFSGDDEPAEDTAAAGSSEKKWRAGTLS